MFVDTHTHTCTHMRMCIHTHACSHLYKLTRSHACTCTLKNWRATGFMHLWIPCIQSVLLTCFQNSGNDISTKWHFTIVMQYFLYLCSAKESSCRQNRCRGEQSGRSNALSWFCPILRPFFCDCQVACQWCLNLLRLTSKVLVFFFLTPFSLAAFRGQTLPSSWWSEGFLLPDAGNLLFAFANCCQALAGFHSCSWRIGPFVWWQQHMGSAQLV